MAHGFFVFEDYMMILKPHMAPFTLANQQHWIPPTYWVVPLVFLLIKRLRRKQPSTMYDLDKDKKSDSLTRNHIAEQLRQVTTIEANA